MARVQRWVRPGTIGPTGAGARHNMRVRQTDELTRLEAALDHIRQAPADNGTVELIVRRPAEDQREVLAEAWLDVTDGLEGDTWRPRGSSRTADGGPDPQAQLTLMNARSTA